ncbi:MAG: helicase-exonuclease AddAB subunit AddA [Oscillospiraceae bacterium]|nr:helicase-exonuclease AddAB subunit AddA [Oscillospiraceae bacterium]MBQ7129493.1 helicase-exonuclease AddAB subunit AddA [Oscillospiraceae bacterium]
MADKLTPQQRQAVENRGGKLLVSAAAGSGKTKVLVDRLMGYLTDPVSPANLDEFLIITYTKAAASELRGKIASKLTERIAADPENKHLQKQMQRLFLTKISTVHGFCTELLREYAYHLDLAADFRVADENECLELRQQVLTELLDQAYLSDRMDGDFQAFVDSQGLGRDDRLVPELILKIYDSARCHLDPDGWLEKCVQDSSVESMQDVSQTVWGNYLMEDLKDYLRHQIRVMEQCVRLADQCAGFEKPAENLRRTLVQLQELEAFSSWDDVVRHNSIDYGRLVFPKKNGDPELADRIKAARNACKKGLDKKLLSFTDGSGQLLQDLEDCSGAVRGIVSFVRRFDQAFTRAKKMRRILDFSDLEHKTLDLLTGKSRTAVTAAAREIGSRFREVMVDEYQDSNGVQDAIFSALTAQKQNCFMVGDVKQSIYQFRLADPGIFLEKYRGYVPAEDAQNGMGRKVFLSHNFRSGPEVISAVNDVFSCCMSPGVGGLHYGEAEALREGIPREKLPEPAVELHAIEIREDTYAEEAAYVADQIHRMLSSGSRIRKDGTLQRVSPEDIVILLRSPGSVGAQFRRALEARGIRCSSGGGTDLLATEEIATLRSFLQIIVNPRQDIPLISTLASPVFGFTADDLAQIRAGRKKESFYDALLECGHPKAESFLSVLLALRREARMSPLTQLLEKCFSMTRLDSIYAAMENGDIRRENLQTFFRLASDFEQGHAKDLSRFLQHLESLDGRGIITAGTAPSGCVTIMSIHKSKGLEFPVVFLCGLSRIFNRESLQAQILCDRELGLGLSVADTENRIRYASVAKRAIMVKAARESLSEEMRVLYVAMTRARDRLIMTYTAKNLKSDLQEITLRMDFDGGALLCRDVVCPGEWVLLAAVQRMEAGALHAAGGRPAQLKLGDCPWKICVGSAPDNAAAGVVSHAGTTEIPEFAEQALKQALSFCYPHAAATKAPSKQTATDRKGRWKDAEAAEHTEEPRGVMRNWRTPSFVTATVEGKTYGNAIHAAMQYIRYENCGSEEAVQQEIRRLTAEGFLSEEQGKLVNSAMIAAFFRTEIGEKLRMGVPYLREFKFSILDAGSHYGDGLEGEQVLLQGVVDCALLEPDGITIVDFKTDRVTEESIPAAVAKYAPQVETYAEALQRIYEMPVKARYLYLFRLNRLVEL